MSTLQELSARGRTSSSEAGLHVDVRGLPCPEPLVALLRLIDSGEATAALFAHLDQEPLLLYPELHARGCDYRLLDSDSGDGADDKHVVLAIQCRRR
jgi:TusA-related sulfurtransferase